MSNLFLPTLNLIKRLVLLTLITTTILVATDITTAQPAAAYPFWAQAAYPLTPREPTGKIVCANCHLGVKPAELEMPTSVLPDTVFEAVVKIPYDLNSQQVLGDGSKGGLNVGAVVMLPDGFQIAPEDRIPEEMKEKVGGVYFQSYTEDQPNVIIVGPLPGEQYQEIIFPILSPDPATNKAAHFGKYQVHLGANRGRGQLYPTGERTNNNVFTASVAGNITKIEEPEAGGYSVTIQPEAGSAVVEAIPAGPDLVVTVGDTVALAAPLTVNPSVGGFGQDEAEIVLQSADRITWLIAFICAIMLSQALLVLKKKQVEKVQAAELEF